jgi:hypothetical protein
MGTRAYIADGSAGLQVVNVANPTLPWTLGSLDVGDAKDVVVAGEYAYLAVENEVKVVGITDPSQPFLAGSVSVPEPRELALSDLYLYVASWQGLTVIDISVPFNPVVAATMDLPYDSYSEGVHLRGDYAYVAGRGLHVLDVSIPTSPSYVGYYAWPARSPTVEGSCVYLATGHSPLRILPAQCSLPSALPADAIESTFNLLSCEPTFPEHGVSLRLELPAPCPTQLVVWDVMSRQIRHLLDGWESAGVTRVMWRYRDDMDHSIPSGVYFARLSWSDRSITRRITVIR